MNNTYLVHHGVKGQKWGIRRYQDENGDLTAAGRKRYDVNEKGKMSRQGKKLYSRDKYISKEIDYQNNKIKEINKREKHYRDAYNEMLKTRNDKNKYNNIIEKGIKETGVSKKTMETAFKETMTRTKEEANWYKFQADKLIDYNKKLQDLDISNMNKWQITKYYNELGNVTLSEINEYGSNLDRSQRERRQNLYT